MDAVCILPLLEIQLSINAVNCKSFYFMNTLILEQTWLELTHVLANHLPPKINTN